MITTVCSSTNEYVNPDPANNNASASSGESNPLTFGANCDATASDPVGQINCSPDCLAQFLTASDNGCASRVKRTFVAGSDAACDCPDRIRHTAADSSGRSLFCIVKPRLVV